MIKNSFKWFLSCLALILTVFLFGCKKVDFNIEKKTYDLKVGQTEAIIIEADDEVLNDLDLSSKDSSIASVKSGIITANAVGTTKITASFKKTNIELTINVTQIVVSFNTQGGTSVASVNVEYGNKLESPAEPTKTGFDFGGWFIDKDGNTAYDFNSIINDNLTLYARWGKPTYEVKFLVDDEVVSQEDIEHGNKVVQPDNPTKVGYGFLGWYYLYLGEYEIEFDFNLEIEEDLEIYSKFLPKSDIPYTVKHLVYNNETNSYDLRDEENLTGIADKETTISPKEYSGLVSENEEYLVIILPDGSLVVEIKYNVINFSYKLELNGGNFTYKDKAEMINDFLNDYNTWGKTLYTVENIPMGEWVLTNFHSFLYDSKYYEKWKWMPAYLGVVGSASNAVACRAFATVTTASAYNGINSNYIYALSYEIRGFITNTKYTNNVSWMSSDYSDYDLGNGFWPTFVTYKENTNFTNQTEPVTLPTTAYKEGYNLAGWYNNPEFNGFPITSIVRGGTYYAKWTPKNPITHIIISNPLSTMQKYDTHQLQIVILPENAFNKNVHYISSDETVLKVTSEGLITAENVGTATITVKSVVSEVSVSITISIFDGDDIKVSFSNDYDGALYVNDEATINVLGIGAIANDDLSFSSSDPSIVSIDNDGNIKGLALGEAMIDIIQISTSNTLLRIVVPVLPTPTNDRVDQLLKLLKEGNQAVIDTINVSLLYDQIDNKTINQYFQARYGNVNNYLFDNLNLDSTSRLINTTTMTSKHSGIMPSVEFITVHDTANINGGLSSHGTYWLNTTHNNSIHFTVGDQGVIQSLDTRYAAHHAGDGTSVSFKWDNTNIKANGNTNPDIGISTDGYFTFNGTKTAILAPKNNGQILDKSYFTHLGPNWKIGDDDNYYLGTTWFTTSQVSRGVISSRGGNLNSIGIEMCVNTNGNIYDTWQRTAKLVAMLIDDNSLSYQRVTQHNTYTGKNCPQSILYSDYWNKFMEFVIIEHIIKTQYNDAIITLESHNPTILNNKGHIISQSETTQYVTYTITVQIGTTTKSIKLGSVVPGLRTWNQYNGLYTITI